MTLLGMMPLREISENDVLAPALPQLDDQIDADCNTRNRTTQFYEDFSNDDFSDANSEFIDEVARLERVF